MKKKFLLIIGTILIATGLLLYIYPRIEFYKGNYLYLMSYSKNWEESEDAKEIEEDFCYDETYSYNKKRDISILNWDYEQFLFFRWFKINYNIGNICDSEYLLEASYIKQIIKKAKIIENENNIDLNELIKGKKAIVGNNRYPSYENNNFIGFELNGEYKEMFVWENEEGLIIIQVGLSDEGPKYIAYK